MLIRPTDDGAVAITQPHHAWLAGELARAWGAPGFEVPAPRGALLCAIALHDIGWLNWERAPELDPQTGYPLQFDKVAATAHTKLWAAGVQAAGCYGLLPALLVSRHGVAIYDLTFDYATARPEQAKAVCMFIREQAAFQQTAIALLSRDRDMASLVTPEHLEKVKRFIVAVDTLSLHLCWGIVEPVTIDNVPSTAGSTRLVLSRKSEHQVAIDPWPFSSCTLDVTIEGKRLTPARDQGELDQTLSAATPVFQRLTLVSSGAASSDGATTPL